MKKARLLQTGFFCCPEGNLTYNYFDTGILLETGSMTFLLLKLQNRYATQALLILLLLLVGACSSGPQHRHPQASLQYSDREHAVTLAGEKGNFQFTLYSNQSPIPLSIIHSWTLHVQTKDGQIVEDAQVFVFGGMPMHQHGFPTVPRVKNYLGNGDYLVEGIKFSMIGHWEMRFNVKKEQLEDRVVFSIAI